MRSPGLAITWQLFARYRGWWAGGLGFFAVAAAVCQVLPEGNVAFTIRYALAVPLGASSLGVLLVFAIGAEGDMASRESLYPARMFTLPVKTWTLVAWPMAVGVATMLVLGLAFGQFVARSMWAKLPLWEPTLLWTALLVWFQALVWLPFGLRWLRLAAVLAVVYGLGAALNLAHGMDSSGTAVSVVLALQIPIACAVAMLGVTRARSGRGTDWTWVWRWCKRGQVRQGGSPESRLKGEVISGRSALADLSPFARPPFGSALAAQRWFEWRMHGAGMLVAFGLATAFLAGSTVYLHFSPIGDRLPPFAHPAALLVVPLLVAIMGGVSVGEFTAQRYATPGGPAFLATRPMATSEFVRAKWGMAWAGVLWMWGVVVPLAILLMVWLGDYQGVEAVWAEGSSLPERIAIVGAAIVLLPVAVWALAVENLFVSLTGRAWVVIALTGAAVAVFYGVLLLGAWIFTVHREWVGTMVSLAPWMLGGLAALKVALAAWVLRILCRRQLLGAGVAVRLAGIWVAVVVGMVPVAAWLFPAGRVGWPVLVFSVVLAVPAVRLGLGPLALAWNRHR